LSLRSNPGLKLANAFGVLMQTEPVPNHSLAAEKPAAWCEGFPVFGPPRIDSSSQGVGSKHVYVSCRKICTSRPVIQSMRIAASKKCTLTLDGK